MTSLYQYDLLGLGELIELRPHSCCEPDTEQVSPEDNPASGALSNTWGGQERTERIFCDDSGDHDAL